MNKKIKSGLVLLCIVIGFASCTMVRPLTATSNAIGPKVGTSKTVTLFGVFVMQPDGGIQAAAKNGKISKISTVDVKHSNFLFILQTHETIVTGE